MEPIPKFTEKETKPIIMPGRLHNADLSVPMESGDLGYELLVLPEDYEPKTMAPRKLKSLSSSEIKVKYDPANFELPKELQTIEMSYASKSYLFPLGKTWYVIDSKIKYKGFISNVSPVGEPSEEGVQEISIQIEVSTPCE